MMSDIVRIAQERREALLSELEELETFLRIAQKLAGQTDVPTKEHQRRGRRPSGIAEKTNALARAKTLAAQRPLPLRALYEQLAPEVEIGGKDPLATLSARLSNSGEFVSHRGLGWWPKDTPLPSMFTNGPDQKAAGTQTDAPAAPDDAANQGDDDAAALADSSSAQASWR
jgi:hypothetical protein